MGSCLRCFGAEGGYLTDGFSTLGVPGIVRGLHTYPNSRAIAEYLPTRRHWLALAQCTDVGGRMSPMRRHKLTGESFKFAHAEIHGSTIEFSNALQAATIGLVVLCDQIER